MDIYTYGENYYNYLIIENEVNYFMSFKFINFIKNIF